MSVLDDALTLVAAIQTPGIDEVTEQIVVLESEIETLVAAGDEVERLAIKNNVLTSQRRHLAELKQLQVNVDELLYQSFRCEISLSRTRTELAAIKTGSSGSGVNSVIHALAGTIRRAKEVQEELKGLGF